MAKYIISIDQSTQGTKALLFDETGSIMRRTDRPHRQIINEKGWVSHDPEEIYSNVLAVVKELLKGVEKEYVVGLGISNQRETSLAWNKVTGKPYGNAVVWQCARAVDICARVEKAGAAELIRQKTGMNLSPYFPASKIAWLLENEEGAKEAADAVFGVSGAGVCKDKNNMTTTWDGIGELQWNLEDGVPTITITVE